jgi:hypothetical protein
LLAKFERILKHFPKAERLPEPDGAFTSWLGAHQERAKTHADILRKMVAEDEQRARTPRKPEKEMTKNERIVDLIYRLRDQEAPDWLDPKATGWSGPAAELQKLGDDALPLLVQALDDERFTRTVTRFGINFYWDERVEHVGGLARTIIEEIAGRQFLRGGNEEIRAWWTEIQNKGEKHVLIEGVEAGKSYYSEQQAARLVKKYPDVALSAIVKGMAKADEDRLKQSFVDIAGNIKGAQAVAFMRQQLKAPALQVRLAAARGLHRQGVQDGIQPMIEEWQRIPAENEHDFSVDELIEFLAKSGQLDGVKALGKDLLNRTPNLQRQVIESVGAVEQGNKYPATLAVVSARDDLLVQELSNTERVWGMMGNWSGKSVHDPRLCDLAAHHLSELWRSPDRFDFHTPLQTRERYRVDLMNIWRERQGLPLLPLPPRSRVKRLPDALVKPKLEALLAASSDADRQQALKAIEHLGLPALPAARELLAGMKPEHAAHDHLRKFVAGMAGIVNEVGLSNGSAQPDKKTLAILQVMKGHPLDVTALARFAMAVTKPLPPGVAGVILLIEREGDDSGVNVTVSLSKGEPQSDSFSFGESVRVGQQSLLGAGGGFSWDHYGSGAEHWDDFKKALQKAFDLGPDKTVTARFRIERQK